MTEDFAYEQLWDQKEYLDALEKRNLPDKRKRELLLSATLVYIRRKAEVKKILNIKRKKLIELC